MSRTRTITWQDPIAASRAGLSMRGRAYLEAIASGELPGPPVAILLGFEIAAIDDGVVVFRMTPGEYHYNPLGSVHGGVLTTLCDSAMGCAIQSVLPAGTGYTTVEVKCNFLRPVRQDTGPITCEGRLIHKGKRIATAEARVTDSEGTLYAHGTTTCLLLS